MRDNKSGEGGAFGIDGREGGDRGLESAGRGRCRGVEKGWGGGCGEAPDCLTKAINPEGLSGGPANPSLGSNLPVPSQASYFQQQ